MRKAIDIAYFLLQLFKFDEEGLSNTKLNRLLYYAQGCSYQRFARPLFEDEIEAWEYGPVVAGVYNKFQGFGKNAIELVEAEIELSEEEEDLLIDLAREYGKYSSAGLKSMIHRADSPWSKTYELNDTDNVIPKELIEKHFRENEPVLDSLNIAFDDEDFVGYRDEDGILVLPKEYDE